MCASAVSEGGDCYGPPRGTLPAACHTQEHDHVLATTSRLPHGHCQGHLPGGQHNQVAILHHAFRLCPRSRSHSTPYVHLARFEFGLDGLRLHPGGSPGKAPGHLPRPQVLGLRLTPLACGKLAVSRPPSCARKGKPQPEPPGSSPHRTPRTEPGTCGGTLPESSIPKDTGTVFALCRA